jgi:predicted nucleic acid-binding protein
MRTALAAQAGLIVTGDRTLLSIAKYEGVRILSVGEALEVIAQSDSRNQE